MKPGEKTEIQATIEKLVDGGFGLARWKGQVIFIPGSCPGEEVRAELSDLKRGFAEAELKSVIQASPERVEPPCPVYGECGGCRLQHLAYPAQVAAKVEILRENLARIGKIAEPNILPPIASPEALGYRTRIQFQSDQKKIPPAVGFFAGNSNRVVPVEACLVAVEPANRFLSRLKGYLAGLKGAHPPIKQIHLNYAPGTGELQARYFHSGPSTVNLQGLISALREAVPELLSQVIYDKNNRRRIRGRDYIMDRFSGFDFRISDRSFAQVNGGLREPLIKTVTDFAMLSGKETVLELYCGIGTFSLPLAKRAARLNGMDESEPAVNDALANASQNKIPNTDFRIMSVRDGVEELAEAGERFDRVVLDPPRAGAGRKTLENIVRLEPDRIVYVSCSPATLARDVKILQENGYSPECFQPVDLFPQTHHLETVAAFSRI